MTTRHAFQTALDQNVQDWATRLVFADWLDEHDEADLAFAQRWMAGHKKAPAWRVPYMVGSKITKPWAWYPPNDPSEARSPSYSRLPYPLFCLLLTRPQFFQGYRYYHHRTEAERDLAVGLKALKQLLDLNLRP